jgi:hypothetical protein
MVRMRNVNLDLLSQKVTVVNIVYCYMIGVIIITPIIHPSIQISSIIIDEIWISNWVHCTLTTFK